MSKYTASVQYIKRTCPYCKNKGLRAYQRNEGKTIIYCPKCNKNIRR